MKPFNQFDMEQQIMTCWNVCEDLDTLMEGVLERDMTRDRITNALMGMKELYQLKFETLFETFEAMCRDRAQERQIKKAPGYTNYDRDDDEDDYQLNAHGEVL